ncbi:D-alanyl-D-alanine carboxypeptidase/D-alanyl-D-alanine-endopeptidase [Vallicoccus soli]|uniref:D-alanyl-D-alanine carboxypeptidase/D-alanyl-D-alanine-endopeptidase n=1 Tax=Vallicoccus soli TaxID=2339232 RepID=A0A3A3Z0W6_9ACTN|nr:D-alanyl-D-alanine carboxypeptidase/D-alanyl-D-alanine-endopeptidase [Vallicoccus soli]
MPAALAAVLLATGAPAPAATTDPGAAPAGTPPAGTAPAGTAPADGGPGTAPPVLGALDAAAPAPGPVGLARALDPLLADPDLGPAVSATVVDAATGRPLFRRSGDVPRIPASVTKVVTAAAVLRALGPDAVLRTSVVPGARDGSLVLVGGGDPLLTAREREPGALRPASLVDLADATAAVLRERRGAAGGPAPVALAVDDRLFSGPGAAPSWKPSYVGDGEVAPVAALAADHGLARPGTGDDARVGDPALAAGESFAALLRERGVPVRGAVRRAAAPAGAQPLAEVASPPVSALVERMLQASDNDVAEALARHAAVAEGAAADFAGAGATTTGALREEVADLGPAAGRLRLLDGSGLSRGNRLTSDAVALLLAEAGDAGDGRPLEALLPGLPVAGFSGTLATRYLEGPARSGAGLVRAKTGSLSGVTTLAGQVVDARGRLLTFAVLADDVTDAYGARAALDRVVAAVAACACG